MGQAVRGAAGGGRSGRGATARAGRDASRLIARRLTARGPTALGGLRRLGLGIAVGLALAAPLGAQQDVVRGSRGTPAAAESLTEQGARRYDGGRFTVVAYPSDERLARTVLQRAQANDTFPGLPRPRARVVIAIAPDADRFRAWAGPAAPAWGAAVAFPALQRIVMQGSRAGRDAGDPVVTLRHELAHLALAEALGDLPPRWFDEGYASVAAGEWSREEALAASLGLALRGTPSLEALELLFYRGAGDAEMAYALAHRAVADLLAIDPAHGLSRFFEAWRTSGSFEVALRQAYGRTSADFEKAWQQQTRRRFGALALLANLTLAFGVFAVVIGPFLWQRRTRDRARLAALRLADAQQEAAAREGALDAILTAGGAAHGQPEAAEARYDLPDGVHPDRAGPTAAWPEAPEHGPTGRR